MKISFALILIILSSLLRAKVPALKASVLKISSLKIPCPHGWIYNDGVCAHEKNYKRGMRELVTEKEMNALKSERDGIY